MIRNIDLEDETPYDAGMPHEVLVSSEWPGPSRNLHFGVGQPASKKGVFDSFPGVSRDQFLSLVHPDTTIASTASVGNGCYLEPGVILSPFSQLGFGVTINRGSSIGHHTSVGDFTTINPGVHIAGHCRIGEGVVLGMGSIVFDHISIGDGSKIGGGSVVNKDIPAGVLAYGNPCKVIKQLS